MQSISLISKPIWVEGKCIVRICRVLVISLNILSKKIILFFKSVKRKNTMEVYAVAPIFP